MVIVGAGMAGARAVMSLRASGWDGAITLIGEEQLPPYDRPPLSKAAITEDTEPPPVLHLDDGMMASLKVRFIRGNGATAIDRAAQSVALRDGRTITYGKLLLASGAKPRRLSVPGGERALTLRDHGDSAKLRRAFRDGRSVAIIGGGFIGLELAASARKLGCRVTVIEAQPRVLMRGVPAEVAEVVHTRHVREGVTMETGVGIAAVDSSGVTLADGRRIEADMVIAGIGAAPETMIAAHAGLAIDNGIAVDETLRTSDENIFAAGDCCSFPHSIAGGRIRLESWRNAQDQGTLAGENMLGAGKAYTAVPWFWSDQYDLSLQIAGFPANGTETMRRDLNEEAFVMFHRNAAGRLVGASGIGPGNGVSRDIKLAEMLIARGLSPSPAQLADPAIPLKSLLRS